MSEMPFVGTVADYQRLARDFSLGCNVVPVWRGLGTVLIVAWRKHDQLGQMPVEPAVLEAFRSALDHHCPAGAEITVVSVG